MAQSHATQSSQSLANISIFAGLSSDTLAPLEKRCRWRHFRAAETIVDHLDTSDDVFFIASGKARVSIYSAEGKAITFSDLGYSDVFGEIAAIDGHPRSELPDGPAGARICIRDHPPVRSAQPTFGAQTNTTTGHEGIKPCAKTQHSKPRIDR